MATRTYHEKRRVIIEAFEVDLLTRAQAIKALRILAEKNRKAVAQ